MSKSASPKDFIEARIFTSIKATELVAIYIKEFPDSSHKEMWSILEELKKENKILELEYILPDGYNRIRSIFFPAGTSFKLTSQGEISAH